MTVPNPVQNLDAIPDELNLSRTSFNMGQAAARTLAGVPSGALNMNAFAGKSATPSIGGDQSAEDGAGSHTFTLNVTTTGGAAPFTYQWYITSPSGGTAVFVGSSTASTAFISLTPGVAFNPVTCIPYCAVTDSASRTVSSNSVTLTYTSP